MKSNAELCKWVMGLTPSQQSRLLRIMLDNPPAVKSRMSWALICNTAFDKSFRKTMAIEKKRVELMALVEGGAK